MKITKNRLQEILKEEIEFYINNKKSEKLISELNQIISESNKPNYSPKLGVTLAQFMDELIDKQIKDVEFVKEDGNKMVFSTTTPAENVVLQSLDAKILDDGKGLTLLTFEKEEGVDTSEENLEEAFNKEVDVKSTGEYSDTTIADLKKEVRKLKKENDKYQEEGKSVPKANKKKMGQLLFAIRAKQGWKSKIKE